MTPLQPESDRGNGFMAKLQREPYIIINLIFTGVILLIMAYSGIFSPARDNYPVTCMHEKITGMPCVSCGLSHSFSLIIRGRIAGAYEWNIYGLRIFLFFALQLIMRIVFSIIYMRNINIRKQLIIYDISGSAVLFLISFFPFIAALYSGVSR